jgi:general secretion pathway protein N
VDVALVGAPSNAQHRELPGNPLWELPLERFSMTRERPVFLPSRRQPDPPTFVAPVTVRRAAKPPEPERPAVSLIGTVVGADVQIGIFQERATHNVVRLRPGEEHQGWLLRLLKAREATLAKDVEETLVLDPTPGDAATARATAVSVAVVPNSIGTIPVVNTAEYVDEQPIPRGAQRQRQRQ